MKRKIAWLALPLVLGVLAFAAKWRAEHPTPTKEDLEVRALMREASQVEVADVITTTQTKSLGFLSRDEISSLADNVYCLHANSSILWGSDTIVIKFLYRTPTINGTRRIEVTTGIDGGISRLDVLSSPQTAIGSIAWELHPATVKSWFGILKANPRIGPELRARMKS